MYFYMCFFFLKKKVENESVASVLLVGDKFLNPPLIFIFISSMYIKINILFFIINFIFLNISKKHI